MHKASSIAIAFVNLIWKLGKFAKVERFKSTVWLLFSNKDWHHIPMKKEEREKKDRKQMSYICLKRSKLIFLLFCLHFYLPYNLFAITAHSYISTIREQQYKTITVKQQKKKRYSRSTLSCFDAALRTIPSKACKIIKLKINTCEHLIKNEIMKKMNEEGGERAKREEQKKRRCITFIETSKTTIFEWRTEKRNPACQSWPKLRHI